jgi:2-deoxy-D-gluconate 3-dehydrogenase
MNIFDKFKLDSKIAFATGLSSGIGQAIAIGLAEAGATVICYASRQSGASETVAGIGGILTKFPAICLTKNPAKLIAEIIEKVGRLDVLINNVGTFGVRRRLNSAKKIVSLFWKSTFYPFSDYPKPPAYR